MEENSDSEGEWVLEQYSDLEMEDDEDVVYQRAMHDHMDNGLYMSAMRDRKYDLETEMDTPYQSMIKAPRTLGEHPKHKARARQCLAEYVRINGILAYTLFDTGSTFDLISPKFVRIVKIITSKLNNPAGIKLGCVGSRSSINCGCQVQIEVVGETTSTYLDVVNID